MEKKIQLQKIVEEADMELTKDLFMDTDNASGTKTCTLATKSMESMNPSNVSELEEFKRFLLEKIRPIRNRPEYSLFLEGLIRELAFDLQVEQIKELSKVLSVVTNEKLRADKEAKTKKKSSTASKRINLKPVNDLDYTDYQDMAEDFEDFM